MAYGRGITEPDLPLHRKAAHAERQLTGQGAKLGVGLRIVGLRRDDADPMATHRLTLREINHMAEQSAHRRPQHVKDFHRGRVHHRQKPALADGDDVAARKVKRH